MALLQIPMHARLGERGEEGSVQVVQEWWYKSGGTRVVQEWYKSGTRVVVQEWYKSGTRVVQEWYKSGTRVVQEWYKCQCEGDSSRCASEVA